MFLEYYGLREQPFGVTPDPRFLYFSGTHREALASLFYGIESGCGFLALVAPPGMGKTTLLFHLLEKLRGSAQTAFLFQTQCGSREFFRYLLTDLGADASEQNIARMHEALNAVLLRNARLGRRFVLVIDEAQNLDESVLETVRLLSDFETPRAKLLQIVLSGQPQLADKLSHPSLVQLRQRISIASRLHPYSRVETMTHIEYRLCTAGYSGPALFKYDALELIAAQSGGIPRNINNICFNAMTLAFAKRQKRIDSSIVAEVLDDLDIEGLGTRALGPARSEGDALSVPEGVAPVDDATYEEFHNAIRSAWAGSREEQNEEQPLASQPVPINSATAKRSHESIFQVSPDESAPPEYHAVTGETAEKAADSAVAPGAFRSEAAPEARPEPKRGADRVREASSLPHPLAGATQARANTTAASAASARVAENSRMPAPLADKPQESISTEIKTWTRALYDLFPYTRRKSADQQHAVVGRTMISVVFIIVLGGTFILSRARERDGRAQQDSRAISPADAPDAGASSVANDAFGSDRNAPAKNSGLHASAASGKESIITLEFGQTLSKISLQHLGRFNDALTREIQALNPEIKNPDVIYAGSKIRMPLPSDGGNRETTVTEPGSGSEERTR